MMKDGRPYTTHRHLPTDARLITDRTPEEQAQVMAWIRENILPRKNANWRHTSYGIKHILQRDINIYLSNNEFKDAMLLSGYEPVDPDEINWVYRISQRSEAFRPEHRSAYRQSSHEIRR